MHYFNFFGVVGQTLGDTGAGIIVGLILLGIISYARAFVVPIVEEEEPPAKKQSLSRQLAHLAATAQGPRRLRTQD